MRILGIDPALSTTGYGVIDTSTSLSINPEQLQVPKQGNGRRVDFNRNKIVLLEAGIIQTSVKDPVSERLLKIYQGVESLIADTKPEVMVLEKLFAHYHHPTTAFLLGQARGVICLTSAEAKIPLVEYAATRVKKAIVGQGLASKIQVQRMVVSMLGLKELPKYTDVTDALALAIAHSNIMKFNPVAR